MCLTADLACHLVLSQRAVPSEGVFNHSIFTFFCTSEATSPWRDSALISSVSVSKSIPLLFLTCSYTDYCFFCFISSFSLDKMCHLNMTEPQFLSYYLLNYSKCVILLVIHRILLQRADTSIAGRLMTHT